LSLPCPWTLALGGFGKGNNPAPVRGVRVLGFFVGCGKAIEQENGNDVYCE
jgi:hypothetical protein